MIQYTLEMYMDSGISQFCIITRSHKSLLKNFLSGDWSPRLLPYQRDESLYRRLAQRRIVFITQEVPKGVADAVWLAKDFVGNEPFACIMPDCLLFSPTPFAQQLIEVFQRHRKNVIGTVLIRSSDIGRFGNVGLLRADGLDDRSFEIRFLSDKKQVPISVSYGTLVHKGFGGGIYLPEYFELVEMVHSGVNGEVDDVPVHQTLIEKGELLGALLEGAAFDAGHPLGFRAAVHYVGRHLPP
jgi:UTP--glucose-1-phosphate uridylyltransferase